jgi:pyridoxamine 5'-phosphate oxidase
VPGPEYASIDPGLVIPRPPHWGGYHVWADAVELWVEGESRIHDRACWTRSLAAGGGDGAAAFVPGPWSVTRLQP